MTQQTKAQMLAELLRAAVQIWPQVSEDNPGGYMTEVDQVMDDAAAELRRLDAVEADRDQLRAQVERLQGGEPTKPLHVALAPLLCCAAEMLALLGSIRTVAPPDDIQKIINDLRAAANGTPVTAGSPTAAWLEVGRVAELAEDTAPPAAPAMVALTDERIEQIAHRMCWQYKHSTDPNHSHTYKFNRTTLIDFVRHGIGTDGGEG